MANFSEEEWAKLKEYTYLISWLEDIETDLSISWKPKGYISKSTSKLFFKDKFIEGDRLFSAENANEGVLHILFYLVLFISKRSPEVFGIDNIESALNPHLCREIMKIICELNTDKTALITTHNPAILDGLDLTNDDVRLFKVYRNGKGHTEVSRIQFKKGQEKKHKLSTLWTTGMLGAIPKNF